MALSEVSESGTLEYIYMDEDMYRGEATDDDNYYADVSEEVNLIREVLTSAIDDEPFVAYFNPATGNVSSFDMDGNLTGIRYVADEDEFWELVRINREVTALNAEYGAHSFYLSDRINRDVVMIDLDTYTLIEYDSYGNRTETSLSGDYVNSAWEMAEHLIQLEDWPFFYRA